MIRISPAPPLPYTPGAPLKYRRADIVAPESEEDVEGNEMSRYEDGELPSSVPLSVNRSYSMDIWA